MKEKQVHQLNDRTLKYQALAQAKRLHQYLGLPGKFKTRLPQEIVFPNMVFGRADEYYLTEEDMVINLEEESGEIKKETKDKLSRYVIFASYRFLKKVYQATICHIDPKKEWECYGYAPSFYTKIHYIHFKQEELWEKYDNLNNKVEQKKELTDTEALDIAFVGKYISKEYSPQVIERLTQLYKNAIIKDKLLRMDVGVILGGMVLKHITPEKKQNKLLERIGMRYIEKEIDKLVYDEYGEKLDAKDKEIEEKDKKIEEKDKKIDEYKKGIEKLNETTNLPPEAKKIISSIMLL